MPTVTRNGVQLFWSEQGSGPAVLWHTGGGGDGSMWERAGYLEALPGRRHLLLDHRGHGRSDKPEGVDAHRLDEYVADVLAVLDQAALARATLVGYSDGGLVVHRFAALHPDRVSAVISIGGVSHPGDTHDWRRGVARDVRRRTFRAWLEDMSAGESEAAPPWLLDNLASTSTEMFALEVDAWADEPTECADFPRIAAPALIVCGEKENGDGAAELAAAALPDGACRVLPGLGHLQAFWHAELTAPLIAGFLDARVPS